MKAIPIKLVDGEQVMCTPEEATYLKFKLPSVGGMQMLPVITKGSRKNSNAWTWNGDTEKPTLRPSLLVKGHCTSKEDNYICHSWVNDGKAQFLIDSTHDLAGKTIDLLDVTF